MTGVLMIKCMYNYIAEINKKMQKPSLNSLLLILMLVSSSLSYDLTGSWQLVTDGPKYQSIDKLTFQFMKDVDSQGEINTKLFIYDCFIAQFDYEVTEDQIALNFKTSSMLSEECSLNAINQVRTLMKKVFTFGIMYDKLLLYNLDLDTIFLMQRLKLDYLNILVGAWQLTSFTQLANNPARINSSNINLCGDRGQLKYSISSINGTYPQLKTQVILNQGCSDTLFLSLFSKCSFFQVSQNRTHIIFYDSSLRYLFNSDQIGKINSNSPLSAISTQGLSQNKQKIQMPQQQVIKNIPQQQYQSTTQSAVTSQQGSIRIQPQQIVNQQVQIPIQTKPVLSQQTQNPTQIQTSTILVQQQSQQRSQIQIVAPVQTPQSSNENNVNPNMKPEINTFSFDLTKNNQFSGFFSSAPIFGSSSVQNKIDPSTLSNNGANRINQIQAQSNVQQEINPTSSFSSSSLLSTSTSHSQPTVQQTINSQSSFSFDLTSGNDNFNYDPNISDSFFTEYGLTKSSQQLVGSNQIPMPNFQVNNPINQKADQIQPNKNDLAAFSSTIYKTLSVSQIIKSAMNSSANRIPTSQFLISNKWLLKWLNGFNSLPSDLRRVYMIFTSSKIILYCPCNTYYTNYKLQGNDFKGISWYGTNKQCYDNRDYLVTNYVFYSSSVRPSGDNLYLWYKNQAKMVMFQPYY